MRLLTSLEANSSLSQVVDSTSATDTGLLKQSAPQRSEAFSDRQQPAPWSSVNWATLERSTTVHGAVSSDKQLCRYSKNGVSITEVKAISLAACKVGPAFLKLNFYLSISIMSMGMGVVLVNALHALAQARVDGPERNGNTPVVGR